MINPINWLFKEPDEKYNIIELNDIMMHNDINNILIINSNFLVDNLRNLKMKKVFCYDIEENVYQKNKGILMNLNVYHKLINIEQLNNEKINMIDLIIYEEKYHFFVECFDIKLRIEKSLSV